MEVDMAAGRHRHVSRLQRPPFSPANPDRVDIQRRAEHLLCEASFRFTQRAFVFVYRVSRDHEFANGLVTAVAQGQFVRHPQRDAPKSGFFYLSKLPGPKVAHSPTSNDVTL